MTNKAFTDKQILEVTEALQSIDYLVNDISEDKSEICGVTKLVYFSSYRAKKLKKWDWFLSGQSIYITKKLK